jgi:hypothetical protein
MQQRMQIPLWPFLTTSLFVGVFGLFPYLCLWQPSLEQTVAPPSLEELKSGKGALLQRAFESRWFAACLTLSAAFLVGNAATAGVPAWNAYFHLFDESRFVHVMSIDFCSLCALLPFFMWWDADQRQWEWRDGGVPILAALPLFGPLVYLLVRPRTMLTVRDGESVPGGDDSPM